MMLNVIVSKLEERLREIDEELYHSPESTKLAYYWYLRGRQSELKDIINQINTQGGKWYDEYIDSCMIQLH